jgi:hypothetical protein
MQKLILTVFMSSLIDFRGSIALPHLQFLMSPVMWTFFFFIF